MGDFTFPQHQQNALPSSPVPSCKKLTSCPMCKGKGYFEKPFTPSHSATSLERVETKLPTLKDTMVSSDRSMKKSVTGSGKPGNMKLPVLGISGRKSSSGKLVDGFQMSRDRSPITLPTLSKTNSDSDIAVPMPRTTKKKNTHEAIQNALAKLKKQDWDAVVEGLGDAMAMCRSDSSSLGPLLPAIHRAIVRALRSPRTRVVKAATQAATEIFKRVHIITRPEFDEMVNILLNKMAEKNKWMREDATTALEAIADYAPIKSTLRAIVSTAPRHKNYAVREAVAQLLVRLVNRIGPQTLLNQQNLADCRARLLTSAALLLNDANNGVRAVTKQLFIELVNEPDFDDILAHDVDAGVLSKIEKQLILLRYAEEK